MQIHVFPDSFNTVNNIINIGRFPKLATGFDRECESLPFFEHPPYGPVR